MNRVLIDQSKCIGCGMCVKDCPQGCLSIEDGRVSFIPDGCMACCHCICICPQGALSLEGEQPGDYMDYVSEEYDIDPDRLQKFMSMRRSIRSFTDEPVTMDEIESLIDAARYAPSAVNANRVRYSVIVNDMDRLKDLVWKGYKKFVDRLEAQNPAKAKRGKWRIAGHEEDEKNDRLLFGARAAIIVSAPRATDASIAATYMELKAHAMGLGVLISEYTIVSLEEMDESAEWLGVDEEFKPVMCLLIGHPRVKYRRIPTRVEADVVMI